MRKRLVGVAAVIAVAGSALTGCSVRDANEIRIGSQLAVDSLDPAVGYTEGSIELANQLYGFLLKAEVNSEQPALDLAASAAWASSTEYDVSLPSGLSFANGNVLDSSDVVFSVNRALALEETPAALLAGLASVTALDANTVRFTVKTANDVTFPWLLTTVAAAIIDEETFPADAVLADSALATTGGFAGPYQLTSANGQLFTMAANANYAGARTPAGPRVLRWQSYDDPVALQHDAEAGTLDVLYGMTPSLGEGLEGSWSSVISPSGTTVILAVADGLPGDDSAQQAARIAIAQVIDREALASDWQVALTSLVPFEVWGSFDQPAPPAPTIEALPDAPIALTLRYASDSTTELADGLAAQLNASGLFAITPERVNAEELLEDGWHLNLIELVPDYADADNYLTPLVLGGSLGGVGPSEQLTEQVLAQAFQPDSATRQAELWQIQSELAEARTLQPIVQRNRVLMTSDNHRIASLESVFEVPQLVSLGSLTHEPVK